MQCNPLVFQIFLLWENIDSIAYRCTAGSDPWSRVRSFVHCHDPTKTLQPSGATYQSEASNNFSPAAVWILGHFGPSLMKIRSFLIDIPLTDTLGAL